LLHRGNVGGKTHYGPSFDFDNAFIWVWGTCRKQLHNLCLNILNYFSIYMMKLLSRWVVSLFVSFFLLMFLSYLAQKILLFVCIYICTLFTGCVLYDKFFGLQLFSSFNRFLVMISCIEWTKNISPLHFCVSSSYNSYKFI